MTPIETGTEHLTATVDDGVAVLTLNRPERRNALSAEMLAGLALALARVDADDDIGAVVLTGAGGAFCAGGDVKGFAERRPGPAPSNQEADQRRSQAAISGRLARMSTPSIAALPGAAAGAGLSIALACDLRYAADTAVLTTAFAKVGLAGDYGSAWFLVQLVGPAKARELLWLSTKLTAQEALALGLVNAVVAPEDVLARAVDVARQLAGGPRVALAYMKENVELAMHAPLDSYMDVEVTHHLRSFATEDHVEASRAFVEKRAAVFQGR
ncbi:MAG: 2-(1,2-epoxy,2-dihydrophenyl)acetyl-CoA isomerase [Frankiales bacterium]|jgi:2-(1,2-epoxy-1,2-dihydrophenyl)acetyl-CoA isomerase|nr:2-(1,2-epoxy,2-dihydrophenyl)acetyl-CoA isomerase [Frankiales bacterium]